jgi:hypothetical protein
MNKTTSIIPLAACLLSLLGAPASAAGLDSLSKADATGGVRDALIQGAEKAVAQLGAADGFLANPKVKIPLPPSLQKIERSMKLMGMGRQSDELVTAMNRSAEAAVQEARPVLVDAIHNMSVKDAKGILTGGDTAATDYFRRTTSASLAKKFLPIVQQATAKVGLAKKYDELAANGRMLGLVKPEDATVEAYVTRKALDGLFLTIGEQERAIREDPVGAASGLASKVFGALRQ